MGMINAMNRSMYWPAQICAFLLIAIVSGGYTAYAADFSYRAGTGAIDLIGELELRGRVPVVSSLTPLMVREVVGALPDTGRYQRYRQQVDIIYPPAGYRFHAGTEVSGSLYNHGFPATAGSGSKIGMLGALGDWSFAAMNTGLTGDRITGSTGYRWRGVAAASDQIYVRWGGLRGHVQFGKDYLRNGLGLAVSDRQPFEQMQGHFDLTGWLRLTGFAGRLDAYIDSSGAYNRHLAGHRLEFRSQRLCIGASEYVLYGGKGRPSEWHYLLPFYVFQGEQDNRPFDDNVIWDADAKITVPPVRFQAEVMIDDIQIERRVKGDQEPQEIGLACKISIAIADAPAFISQHLEYQMVTGWTYNQNKPWNRWLYDGAPLGAEFGNDFDRLALVTTALGRNYRGRAGLALLRKGQGKITDSWTEPWVNDSTWTSRFPSGIVEQRWTAEVSGQRDFMHRYRTLDVLSSISLRLRYETTGNTGHQPGRRQNRFEMTVAVAGGLHF